MRSACFAIVSWPLVATPLLGQAPAGITGTVLDSETMQPVVAARVGVATTGIWAVTDSAGAFVIHLAQSGTHVLETHALGYALRQDTINLQDAQELAVLVMLSVAPLDLPLIDVTASRTRPAGRYAGFWRRRDRGIGTFFTREDIERRQPHKLADMFQGTGARVIRTDGIGSAHVVDFGRSGGFCPAVVYLDGMMMDISQFGLEQFHPDEIEAIEIYSGPARLPAEFSQTGRSPRGGQLPMNPRCGVVALWSRAGGPER